MGTNDNIMSTPTTNPDFNFVHIADCDDTTEAKAVAANIFKTHPENPPRFVIINGDFAYDNSLTDSTARKKAIDRWFSEFIKPITDRKIPMWPTFGNHDVKEPDYYLQKFAATNPESKRWVYSFKYGNVFFLMLNTESLHTPGSPQHRFTKEQLEANKSATWKIVCFHKQIYNSDGGNSPKKSFRHFHQLFDQYGVDVVLSGHNHNYERTYPLSYNANSPDKPKINDTRQNDYVDPLGAIFVVAGTGGRKLYDLASCEPFVYEQYHGWGHMRFRVMEGGTKLQGRFYDKSLKIQDEFSIKKTMV